MSDSVRMIKKYPNRRLYDTANSGYITLADVKQMVLEGINFQVVDAKTNDDLTRAILLQIILDEESGGCQENEGKRHFGHSSVDYAVHVAREAGARRLALFHHCPSHSDDSVDLMHLYARVLAERVAGNLEVLAAREGLVVELQPALAR